MDEPLPPDPAPADPPRAGVAPADAAPVHSDAAQDAPSADAPPPSDGSPPTPFPLVIGIGAATTGESALLGFVAALDLADVAIMLCVGGQADFDDPALLARVQAVTTRTVTMATDGAAVLADTIHLAPAQAITTVTDGHMAVRAVDEPMGERGRIDSLLVSIAEAQGEHAVGVVLAGVGSDGTLGVTALKEHGGLTIAEETDESRTATMLTVGAATSIADFVLPRAEIAACIARYQAHLARARADTTASAERDAIAAQLSRIAAILRDRTGHDFHGYKQNTFMRRVERRMKVTRADTVDAYIAQMEADPDEVQLLFHDMLIGVTQFFRDRREFEALERQVVPQMFAGKTAADQVRIWVLGCATGEEAYSLAILMREQMMRMDAVPHVQIFATDIDGRALAAARVGRFDESIVRDVSPERLKRWFVREGNTYCVVKELREMCIFSQHNLIKDAPFSRLDLVSCRNLLIYLNTDLQTRIIPLFHFALVPGGHLFLGNSENVTRHAKLFTPVDRGSRLFRRLETTTRVLPDFPLLTGTERRGEMKPGRIGRAFEGTLARRAERVAERYAPAYIVVDAHFEALHFSGRTGRYLDPTGGAASLGVLNLVHRDLRLDLRAALHLAAAGGGTVRMPPLRMAGPDIGAGAGSGETAFVSLVVEPVGTGDDPASYVIVFREGDSVEDTEGETPLPLVRDEHIQRIEAELRITRERLQATIEELESTNEELKSSNEEYQSINEELQSANEELETGKEEIQSVNEELQTVNGELGHRVVDLARANSDLKNLLESTQIATLFLDNDLRVRSFTPALADIFHLIDTDLGRPIAHIAGKVRYDDIAEDVRRVMRTLTTVEREVTDERTGARWLMRILPYRSVDNFIAGVVLTFLDVTAVVQAEAALKQSEERFRVMAQSVPIVLFTADERLSLDYVNDRYYDMTGQPGGSALGQGWLAAVHPDDVDIVQSRWRAARDMGQPLEAECRLRSAAGGWRWTLLRADVAHDRQGRPRWSGSFADVDALRQATDRQRVLTAELQHRVKNILAVVRSILSRTVANGGPPEEIIDHFRGRLDALVRTQLVAARTPEGGVEIEDLVRDELLSVGAADGPRVTIAGPPVQLDHRAVETVGLAVHELATNAVKYGALIAEHGRLEIGWSVTGDAPQPRLRFHWIETGVAIVTPVPQRVGFGRELIEEALPYQLGATTALEFAPGGIRCTINLPLMGDAVGPGRPGAAAE